MSMALREHEDRKEDPEICFMVEKFDGLIESPLPSATLEIWERHLERLKKIEPTDSFKGAKAALIRRAKAIIAAKRAVNHGGVPSK
jgi:hypothetical protein